MEKVNDDVAACWEKDVYVAPPNALNAPVQVTTQAIFDAMDACGIPPSRDMRKSTLMIFMWQLRHLLLEIGWNAIWQNSMIFFKRRHTKGAQEDYQHIEANHYSKHNPWEKGKPSLRFTHELCFGKTVLSNNTVRVSPSAFSTSVLLPAAIDASLDNWFLRVKRILNPHWLRMLNLEIRFGLIVNNPECCNFDMYQWAKRLMGPIHERTGYIGGGGVYNAIFSGDYISGFGPHLDPESVIHVPVIGTKSMRTWLPDVIEKHPGAVYNPNYLQMTEILPSSKFISAGPGAFIYWPSDLWHTHESISGEFSVAVAVATFYNQGTPFLDASQKRRSCGGPETERFAINIKSASNGSLIARIDRLKFLSSQGLKSPPLVTAAITGSHEDACMFVVTDRMIFLRDEMASWVLANGNVLKLQGVEESALDSMELLLVPGSRILISDLVTLLQKYNVASKKDIMAFMLATRTLRPVG